MNAAIRPPGHFARILRLLRTPVHLPGWGTRRQKHRPLPVALGSSMPLRAHDEAGESAAVPPLVERAAPEVPHHASAPQAAASVAPRAPVPAAAVASPDAAAERSAQPPSRITRSLEEVRADLARMREQARARAEQSQAHALALAQLREAERAHRDNSFAPTDFMDFSSAGTPPSLRQADKPLLDDDLFSAPFAATDFQGLDHGGALDRDHDDGFGATAFLPPTALPRGSVG